MKDTCSCFTRIPEGIIVNGFYQECSSSFYFDGKKDEKLSSIIWMNIIDEEQPIRCACASRKRKLSFLFCEMNSILSAFKLIFKSVQIQLKQVYTGGTAEASAPCIGMMRSPLRTQFSLKESNNAAPNHCDNKNSKQIINTTLKMDVYTAFYTSRLFAIITFAFIISSVLHITKFHLK